MLAEAEAVEAAIAEAQAKEDAEKAELREGQRLKAAAEIALREAG